MYTNNSLLQTIQIITGDLKTNRYRAWFPATRDPEPVLTSVGASFPTLGHQQ